MHRICEIPVSIIESGFHIGLIVLVGRFHVVPGRGIFVKYMLYLFAFDCLDIKRRIQHLFIQL